MKYSGLQTLALLSLDSVYDFFYQVYINPYFQTHTLTYDCGLHIRLLHYLCSFLKGCY